MVLIVLPAAVEGFVEQLESYTCVSGGYGGVMDERIGGRARSEDYFGYTSARQSVASAAGEPGALIFPPIVLDLNIFEALKNRIKPMGV